LETIIPINIENPDDKTVDTAIDILAKGKMIIFPTETLYGLGVDCENEQAVKRLYKNKQREENKPVSILISDIGMLFKYADTPSADAIKLMDAFWPGPLTLVFKAQPNVKSIITGGTGAIGIRIPSCVFCRKMVQRLGHALTATSANISGNPGCNDIGDIPERLRKAAGLILNGGKLEGTEPSTVLAVYDEKPVMLREGKIPRKEIEKCLGFTVDVV